MLDVKVFMVLILSFSIWDLTMPYIGLASLILGLDAVAMTSPVAHSWIDKKVHQIENTLRPITKSRSWKKYRSILYLMFITSVSMVSYLLIVGE